MYSINKKIAVFTILLIFILFVAKTTNIPFVGIDSKWEHNWSIGIYKIFDNNGFLKAISHPEVNNPALTAKDVTDRKAEFVADPFIVNEGDLCYMFFEVMGQAHGDIGLATSKDTIKWEYQKIVLDEPFHLSFPYVFKWRSDYYMVPESSKDKSIRLYKAEYFPYKWRFVKKLIKDKVFNDPILFYYQNKWWLFASLNSTLYLYYADNLEGPWIEHPKSPIIVENANIARSAGNIIHTSGRLIRLAQNDFPHYGISVRAFEIIKLNTEEYEERELKESPLLKASGQGWNRDGMHQLSSCWLSDKEWIASVDGKVRQKQYYFYVELPEVIFRFLEHLAKVN